MEMAKLTSKGQITVPVDVRRKLGLREGSRLLFIEQDNGVLIINENDLDTNKLSDGRIGAAIKNGWSREYIEAVMQFGKTSDPTFAEQPDLLYADRGELFE